MVGYLDPSSAFVGYAGAVAVNRAMGGDLGNFDPAIKYFQDLAENDPIVPKQTSYARVVSGEIPILFDYDFNAYRGKIHRGRQFRVRAALRRHGGGALRDEPCGQWPQSGAWQEDARLHHVRSRGRPSGPTPICSPRAPSICPKTSPRVPAGQRL
jgi:hypothetical protein